MGMISPGLHDCAGPEDSPGQSRELRSYGVTEKAVQGILPWIGVRFNGSPSGFLASWAAMAQDEAALTFSSPFSTFR